MIFNPPIDYTFKIGYVLIALGRDDQVDSLKNLGDEIKKGYFKIALFIFSL